VRDQRSSGLLIVIGLFRLGKAALLILGGIATLRGDLLRWIRELPIAPGHQYIARLAAAVTRLPERRFHELAIGAFAYATLFIVEGTGLIMRRVWAEYLTIVATTSFIPFEIYEIVKRTTPLRVAFLVVNVAIVIYLVWRRVESRSHEGHTRFLHRRS
jgi:uncharacterized membrane protein (DUF2068 family)